MSGPPAIGVSGARRTFRPRRAPARVALEGVSLQIEAGAWVALLGPNGSGKSTLLGALAGLVRLDAGSAQHRGRRAVVFQSPGLDPLLSVRENLRLEGALHGLSRRESDRRAEDLAALLGLDDRAGDRVGRLSGGLARRADLARALVGAPDVMLLDEPSGGLDLTARRAFLDALERARAARPMTVLMSTHHMDEASRAQRVVMLAQGRVVADGPPEALVRRVGARVAHLRLEDGAIAVRDRLAALGWRAKVQGDRLIATLEHADPAAEAGAVEAAAAAGARCVIGAPTLGDAYEALTGAALEDGP